MTDISTSGPIDDSFLTVEDSRPYFEEVPDHGFSRLVKTRRQGRWFMLKGLMTEFLSQLVYQELLKKEYALMVQLDHPNIVKAYAKEVNDILGPCIVMEYVDGITLDAFLESDPSRDARRKVLDQLTDALVYIHSKQILHRDLKPGNILVTRNGGNVKIIDFGLSDSDDFAILKQSAGTAKYMAPEQASGAAIDCRADIYSFGLVLRKLFPRRYRGIAKKCTRQDPGRRFESMEAVRKALSRSDRRRRLFPYICLASLFAVLLALPRPGGKAVDYSDSSGSITEAQKAYLESAFWQINASINEIIREADEKNSYREVMVSKLSKLNLDLDARREDMADLYQSGTPEQLHFITQFSTEQKLVSLKAMKEIDRLPSFNEEFNKGRISQRKRDSLKWVIHPDVKTLPVVDVTATTARGGLELLDAVFAKGVRLGICWSPCHNPTVKCNHAELNLESGSGQVAIGGLAPGSSYFVRSFVETGAGIAYGDEVSFTTSDSTMTSPEGALVGLFTVSPGRQVAFSKGNLQFRASTPTWRFADQQFDFVGKDNSKLSQAYDGWIDLFGWGTSGYDHGAVNFQPWSPNLNTDSDRLHYAYGRSDSNLYDGDGKADWGYNRIVGGGDEENIWRTLRTSEFVTILFGRETASGVRFAKASVAGRNGLLILPDNWKVSVYPLNSVNDPHGDFSSNTVSQSDWASLLEPAGAVFLPEAGARTIGDIFPHVGGYYTSEVAGSDAWHLLYDVHNLSLNPLGHRGDGLSVRLVRDAD